MLSRHTRICLQLDPLNAIDLLVFGARIFPHTTFHLYILMLLVEHQIFCDAADYSYNPYPIHNRIAIPERFLRPEGKLHRSAACEKLNSSHEFLDAERPDSRASNSSSSNIQRQPVSTKFGDLALVAVYCIYFYLSYLLLNFLYCSTVICTS